MSWLERTGDPSRIHHDALAARVAVEEAREAVASFLGARSREVVFTSGATEAIVTATYGAAERGSRIIVPAVEHSAVRSAAAAFGAVVLVDVDANGRVDPAAVTAALDQHDDVALVHLQWANHEVATLQPVAEVAALCRARKVLLHIDAATAAGHVPIDFGALGADLLSVSAHKFGGPLGAGALLVRRGLRLRPLMVGGDQERARRAGIENVPAIAGFGAACNELSTTLTAESARQRAQTERLIDGLSALDGVRLFGHPTARVPHLACYGIDDVEPQAVLLGLDRAGIAAHSGSACASEGLEPSPVLEAMGADAHRSLRLSVGWSTTDADIDAALRAVPQVLAYLRSLRP